MDVASWKFLKPEIWILAVEKKKEVSIHANKDCIFNTQCPTVTQKSTKLRLKNIAWLLNISDLDFYVITMIKATSEVSEIAAGYLVFFFLFSCITQ